MARSDGYTKVFQDDGTCVHLPLVAFDQFVAALNTRHDFRASWEGVTAEGGCAWIRLDTVTCVLEVTPELAAEDQVREVTGG